MARELDCCSCWLRSSSPDCSHLSLQCAPRSAADRDELLSQRQGVSHAFQVHRRAQPRKREPFGGLQAVNKLKRQDVDLTHGRIWIKRIKGSLSTEQPLQADELRTLKRYLTQRGNAQLPWLFLNERGDQFTRSSINYLVGIIGGAGWSDVSRPSAHAAPWLWLRSGQPRL